MRGKFLFKATAFALMCLLAGTWIYIQFSPSSTSQKSHTPVSKNDNAVKQTELTDIHALFEAQRSGVMVSTAGNVTRILSDDTKGSKHQLFVIEIPQGITLLVAHNIDLAPRIPLSLKDHVAIFGQYEWNHKGGLIHWTHRDPKKIHPDGWVMHQNVKYE